jgi:threonine/homoserine/homoserine lactone efflux protein
MLGTHDVALFIVAGLLLNTTPGADTLYIVSRSLSQGTRAGMLAALGIGMGCFVHISAAALGLSALLATSAIVFRAVKWVGAAYLLYLGVSLMLKAKAPKASVEVGRVTPLSGRKIFLQGFLTNALNPKVALFFLAFVPQFITPEAAHKTMAFLFLGVLFNINGTLWNLFLAWSAARCGRRLAGQSSLSVWLHRSVGGLLIGLGLKLAVSKQS